MLQKPWNWFSYVLRIVGQYVYIWGRIHLNQRDAIVDIQLS